jgi:myo-inositol-1(or 4)-monophosphatase
MQPSLTIATRAARAAGRLILRYFERVDQLQIQAKTRNDFVSEVDRAAEDAIIQELKSKYPNHAFLAEESGPRGRSDFEWIIDPLDGTTNYLHGFPQFSVSIALRVRGRLECGLVYDPLREEMFTAERGGGAQLNDRRIRVANLTGLEGALIGTGFPFRDQRHIDTYLSMFRTILQNTAGIRRPGSAALDLAYVACGRTDGFWELGLVEWDMAAGALLVSEAGGRVSDLAGGDRFFVTGNIIGGNLKVHRALLQALQPHLSEVLSA